MFDRHLCGGGEVKSPKPAYGLYGGPAIGEAKGRQEENVRSCRSSFHSQARLPTSWATQKSLQRHCDEQSLTAPVDHQQGWTRAGTLKRAAHIVSRPHRLAVDLLDNVSALKAGLGGGAGRIDRSDHYTLSPGSDAELAGEIGREGNDADPEPRCISGAFPALFL
jgi:hypothetical protein